MVRVVATGVLLMGLAGCSRTAAEAELLSEARSAVVQSVEDAVSTRFDESTVRIWVEQGLVCGARFKTKHESGTYTEFEPYYFARGRGVAFATSHPALFATLTRECAQAMGEGEQAEALPRSGQR